MPTNLRDRERAIHLMAVGRLMLEHQMSQRQIEDELIDSGGNSLQLDYLHLVEQHNLTKDRAREIASIVYDENHVERSVVRQPEDVIDQLIQATSNKPDYAQLRRDLSTIKSSAFFRPPELVQVTWSEISALLRASLPTQPDQMDSTSKKLIRIFTNNPHII